MIKLRFSHFYSLCLLHRVAIYFLFNKFHLFFWLRSNNNNNNNPLSHPHSTHMKGKFYNQKLFITQDLLQPQGMAIVWARERERTFFYLKIMRVHFFNHSSYSHGKSNTFLTGSASNGFLLTQISSHLSAKWWWCFTVSSNEIFISCNELFISSSLG